MRLIDADALEQRFLGICDMCEGKDSNMCRACAADDMKELLGIAPTIDAVPVVHGRWIMRGGKRYCSACGERACVTRDSDDFWYTVGTRFCPNCGAKMDLEEE